MLSDANGTSKTSQGNTTTTTNIGNEIYAERPHIKLQPPPSSTSATNKLHQPKSEPLILMRHIPSDDQQPTIYGTRQHAPLPPNNNPTNNPLHPSQTPNPRAPPGTSATTARNTAPDDSDPPPPAGTARNQSGPGEIRRMPTPREIMRGLNEYVIGQRNVKIALSVGVYNHYKRIFVAEAFQHTTGPEQHQQPVPQQPQQSHVDATGLMMDSNAPLGHLNLGQFGSTVTQGPPPQHAYFVDGSTSSSTDQSKTPYCETPGADDINHNSIDNALFGRDVEDCEIEKSNIMLLGPTGSGKVSFPRYTDNLMVSQSRSNALIFAIPLSSRRHYLLKRWHG